MKILLAEDDKNLRRGLIYLLEKESFNVVGVNDGKEALEVLSKESFDLLITDVMMPHVGGFELTRKVKSLYPNMKVLVLTAVNTTDAELKSFELNADDYVPKPFENKVLVARAKSLVKSNDKLDFNRGIYDPINNEVTIDEEVFNLTNTESRFFRELVLNKGRAVTREELYDSVWEEPGDIRIVDVHIKNLRKNLNGHSDLIKTVRGRGYMLDE